MTFPNPQNPNFTPVAIQRSPQISAIKIVLGILAILIASILGLLVLLVIGIETGPIGLILGLLAAMIPVPLYVVLVLWIDRYEGEPLWMLSTAFFWGALVAAFFAFLFNTIFGLTISMLAQDANAGEASTAVISAPIVEEAGKSLILFIFFFAKKDEFDGIVDGIVYASMAGLGFAMTENILYYGNAAAQSGGILTATVIVRGFFAPFSHPLFTSLAGIGLGLARQSNNTAVKLITPIVGLLMAIFMHSLWNASAVLGGGAAFLLIYIVVMVPAFLIVLVVIALSLRREGQVVRQFLVTEIEGGLFTREEYEKLGSISGRMGSSFDALSRTGVKGWRTRRRLNQLASELAFHRSRVSRGIHSRKHDPAAQEAAYLHALRALVDELRPR
ncbi:MAG TPA: PrsW family intramembrane metalloprotease [Pyrinomonadaceae bacterium]|nr:PrsW family intramembrane metalloprotease [Pyrinomonadaceae bacterium]